MNRSRYRFLGLVLEGPHERTDLKTFSISANSRKSFRAGLDEVVNVSDLDIGQIFTNMSWKFWQFDEWDPILYLWALWYLLEIETESEIWLSIFLSKSILVEWQSENVGSWRTSSGIHLPASSCQSCQSKSSTLYLKSIFLKHFSSRFSSTFESPRL